MAKSIDFSQYRAAMHGNGRTSFSRTNAAVIPHEELGTQLQLQAGQAVTCP
jgi:hypothetical protein